MADERASSGYPLRQETTEQERYEHEIQKGRYPESIAGDYNEDGTRVAQHDEHHKGKHHDHGHGHGFKDRMRHFWEDIVKPAFPEAITDVHIFGEALHVRTSTKKDMGNLEKWPEVGRVSEVRKGLELCDQEKAYLRARKEHARVHFAKYLDVDPAEVHPDDIPIIGLGGSGGGFRAMIGYIGYCKSMKKAGLWDLITYVSGVSGSCWSLGMYYTFGDTNWDRIIEHCKTRLSPLHPMSGDAIRKLLTAPGGAHSTLAPLVEKHHSGLSIVPMDLYSVFITGYLFLQDDPKTSPTSTNQTHPKEVERYKFTSTIRYLSNGTEPLPILTAIRHERPWRDWVDKENPFTEPDINSTAEQHTKASDAWFQWFEMTPFEVGCDELQAWVPTWGFGRPHEHGKSTMQLPEQSLSLLLGLCTGAPAGPLSSYLATVQRQLPPGFVGNSLRGIGTGIAKMWGKKGTEEFEGHHPLHASNEHNFMFHLSTPPEGQGYPPGLENSPRIHLIDGGMDNNCPTYVLLHPERECDLILNMDASSDVLKDTFQERVDQIGSRRGMKFVKGEKKEEEENDSAASEKLSSLPPPPPQQKQQQHEQSTQAPLSPDLQKLPSSKSDPPTSPSSKTTNPYRHKYAQIYTSHLLPSRPPTVIDSYGNTVTNPPAPLSHTPCDMVYLPLLPNPNVVPDYDPSTAKFSGSYNLVWTREQVEMLLRVCDGNWAEGEETVKRAVRGAWHRRRGRRLAMEREKAIGGEGRLENSMRSLDVGGGGGGGVDEVDGNAGRGMDDEKGDDGAGSASGVDGGATTGDSAVPGGGFVGAAVSGGGGGGGGDDDDDTAKTTNGGV